MRPISGSRCGNQRFQASRSHRDFLRRLVAVEHGERDIDLGLAARRVEHAAAAGPVFDRGGAVGCPISSGVLSIRSRVQPSTRYLRLARRPRLSRSRELVPSAATIRSALMRAAVGQGQLAVGRGRHGRRVEHDLGAGQRRGFGERIDHGLAHDREHPAALPAVHRDHPVLVVAHLAGVGERRAMDRRRIGADRLQHAQAVLVDVDAGAGGAQPVGALVHAHAPAALRQRAGRRQPGKARADDFRMTLRHAAMLGDRATSVALAAQPAL